jgi:hypothetical protein
VVASSRETEFSILAAGLLPPLILLFGEFAENLIDFAAPFTAFTLPIRQSVLLIFLSLSVVALFRLAILAWENYSEARERLFR